MGMDSKSKKRGTLGIAIITLIFGLLSVFSVFRMYTENQEEEKLKKTDYVILLENELNIDLVSEDDFENFSTINYDFIVEPTKYENYYKPCFDFVIVRDGVVIRNSLAKEFDSLGLKVRAKIVKINDTELTGKTYFEILDLLYSKNENEVKKFTFSDLTEIEYQYKKYHSTLQYDEEKNVLYVYNLDNITARAIYDIVVEHKGITLDLSMATANTFDGVVNFLSLFSGKEESLFKTPTYVIGQTGRKIDNIEIVVKDNQDQGVLFALTSLTSINRNIKIDKTDLNTTQFYVVKTLKSANYTIYLKNYLLEAKGYNSNTGGTIM